ncbi:MAG: 1-deoxy-D-xylulose-5-phosphate reductoisomerase [Lentisphaeria bacterium]|nr:1-deoxy-D-xylulose-5-phosphate reductoisomerase [Lentisphaeria bacterium]
MKRKHKKRLAILGSTGSIGRQSLEVVRHLSSEFELVGLVAGRQSALLAEQALEFQPQWVMSQQNQALQGKLPAHTRILDNEEQLCEQLAGPDIDLVLCAIVGTAGLLPVLSAIRSGKDIALASKEILVMAGELVMREAAKSGSRILPVDSEHCAIFQCLQGQSEAEFKRILLTASGGPFYADPELDLELVSLEQALQHPTWSMGRKISLDSATMMNKALEIIEAAWLFNARPEQIEVLVHPQSIVHSMVEFKDHSILAQLGLPDMRLPIQYCLQYPQRTPSLQQSMDFSKVWKLEFMPPDLKRFPATELARLALQQGGAAGAVLNAANEVAVERFCRKEISFAKISRIVADTLQKLPKYSADSLEDILMADSEARKFAATR